MKKYLFMISLVFIITGCTSVGQFQIPTKSVKTQNVALKKGQNWQGAYNCAQGNTALNLQITNVNENNINALFFFNYANVKKGVFKLVGNYDEVSGKLVFEPREWIQRPSGYRTVSMDGFVKGDIYYGKITTAGCSNFQVKLVD